MIDKLGCTVSAESSLTIQLYLYLCLSKFNTINIKKHYYKKYTYTYRIVYFFSIWATQNPIVKNPKSKMFYTSLETYLLDGLAHWKKISKQRLNIIAWINDNQYVFNAKKKSKWWKYF